VVLEIRVILDRKLVSRVVFFVEGEGIRVSMTGNRFGCVVFMWIGGMRRRWTLKDDESKRRRILAMVCGRGLQTREGGPA